MKNASLLINIVLAIGLAVLYFLHFSGQKPAEAEPVAVDEPTEVESKKEGGLTYFINTDTLLLGYGLWEEIEKKFENERALKESRLQSKISAFEQQYISLQQNAASMSEGIRAAQIQKLQQDEQRLSEEKNALEQSLYQSNTKMMNEVNTAIRDYIKKYVADKDISFVLMHNELDNLAYASDGFDITQEIMEGLNAEYEAQKLEKEKGN